MQKSQLFSETRSTHLPKMMGPDAYAMGRLWTSLEVFSVWRSIAYVSYLSSSSSHQISFLFSFAAAFGIGAAFSLSTGLSFGLGVFSGVGFRPRIPSAFQGAVSLLLGAAFFFVFTGVKSCLYYA